MFEFWPREKVMLFFPVETVDGEPQYRRQEADAIVLWETRNHPGVAACADAEAELLLRCPECPVPGTRLQRKGEMWDLGSIRTCRDLDGTRFCYRCKLLAK